MSEGTAATATTSLAIIPHSFDETKALAEYLANASIVPAHSRKQPHNALAMIMAGQEIGLAPMAALRAFHVIEGVPRLTADAMHAVVLMRPGIVEYMHPVENQPERVVWAAKRRGPSAVEIRVTWDKARATLLGKWGNGNWRTNGQQMLNARAKAELARLVAPDIVGGFYAIEEDEPIADLGGGVTVFAKPPEDAQAAKGAPAGVATPAPADKPKTSRKSTTAAAATSSTPAANQAEPKTDPPASSGPAAEARASYEASVERVRAEDAARAAAAAGPAKADEIEDAEIVEEPAKPDEDVGFDEEPAGAAGDPPEVVAFFTKLAACKSADDLKRLRAETLPWAQSDAGRPYFDRIRDAFKEHQERARAGKGGAS